MGKKENIMALKSLFSMLVALISIIGIAITLFSYFVISPALEEMNTSFVTMATTLVKMNDGLALFEKDINEVRTNQLESAENTLNGMEQIKVGIQASRESIQEIEKVNNYGLSSQLINLKTSEDELNSIIYDVKNSYEEMEKMKESQIFSSELSSELLKIVNILDISIKSLSTMFTALTIISLILFSVMILISIGNLL